MVLAVGSPASSHLTKRGSDGRLPSRLQFREKVVFAKHLAARAAPSRSPLPTDGCDDARGCLVGCQRRHPFAACDHGITPGLHGLVAVSWCERFARVRRCLRTVRPPQPSQRSWSDSHSDGGFASCSRRWIHAGKKASELRNRSTKRSCDRVERIQQVGKPMEPWRLPLARRRRVQPAEWFAYTSQEKPTQSCTSMTNTSSTISSWPRSNFPIGHRDEQRLKTWRAMAWLPERGGDGFSEVSSTSAGSGCSHTTRRAAKCPRLFAISVGGACGFQPFACGCGPTGSSSSANLAAIVEPCEGYGG